MSCLARHSPLVTRHFESLHHERLTSFRGNRRGKSLLSRVCSQSKYYAAAAHSFWFRDRFNARHPDYLGRPKSQVTTRRTEEDAINTQPRVIPIVDCGLVGECRCVGPPHAVRVVWLVQGGLI